MDIMSILGIIVAIGFVTFGMVFDSETMHFMFSNLKAFLDPTSFAITVGGTVGVLMISFPAKNFKKIGKHLKIVFKPEKYDTAQYIDQIVEIAKEARMKGLLSLEDKLNDIQDPFLHNSLLLVVDSVDLEKVKNLMETELTQLDERHALDREFYERGASAAPAFGMIGTLIGLILMLGNMSDVDKLAQGMAVALITTLYGSLLANVIFTPMANKLKARHDEEFLCKTLIMEGVIAIQEGENPKFIEEKLYKLLPATQMKLMEGEGEGTPEDGKPKKKKRKRKEKQEPVKE
ncbi:MAG: motility protein A [Faecalicatena sp.]|uniref:motility protein A n=1 Tax=Faecalicatena sp. TaxID=2005360 RepID=UPI0025885834|nr:motility protein A [Faecalicatena sp.]MCI6467477.1 motility protein A [Faecalicatena sp.]MDY5620975.1 motility protein A [Lachnospiraceae bacterium]